MLRRGGFTLIEVLVVIAIIGILAVLIIFGVNKSRAKATDSRIESSFRQLRVLSEDYYIANGFSYAGWQTCIDTPSPTACRGTSTSNNVTALNNDINDATNTSSGNAVDVAATQEEFCMSVNLTFDTAKHICTTHGGDFSTADSASDPCQAGPPRCSFN